MSYDEYMTAEERVRRATVRRKVWWGMQLALLVILIEFVMVGVFS